MIIIDDLLIFSLITISRIGQVQRISIEIKKKAKKEHSKYFNLIKTDLITRKRHIRV